jgi:hypothetical protein
MVYTKVTLIELFQVNGKGETFSNLPPIFVGFTSKGLSYHNPFIDEVADDCAYIERRILRGFLRKGIQFKRADTICWTG